MMPLFIRFATLWTITLVLPEPAPCEYKERPVDMIDSPFLIVIEPVKKVVHFFLRLSITLSPSL